MKVSKFVKKITSVGLAVAMAVSGFSYQPAKAEAAELPVVTVLGATLSLDADAGKQSMRVAIKVENADNASACGMSITYNGKKLDFSTNDDRYNKLYDIDADSGAIVYTVKIANIPKANFGDDFTIEGYATPIAGGSGEDVKTEAPVEKSVDKVVEAIVETTGDDSIKLLDGELVSYYEGFEVDLSKIADDASVEYDSETNSLKGTDAGQFSVPLGKSIPVGYTVDFSVQGSKTGLYIRLYPNKDGDKNQGAIVEIYDDEFSINNTCVLNAQSDPANIGPVTNFMFKCGGWSQTPNTWEQIEIKSITINSYYKELTASDVGDTKLEKVPKEINITLSKENEAITDGLSKAVYADGKANVDFSAANSGYGLAFYIKGDKSSMDLSDYNVVINITSEVAYPVIFESKEGIMSNSYWSNGASTPNQEYATLTVGTRDYVYDWSGNSQAVFIKYNTWVPEGEVARTDNAVFTINSIKLIKK